MRTCAACGESKPAESFPKRPANRCRPCRNSQQRAWRQANPERQREYKRRDRARHPERVRTAHREYGHTPRAKARRARWEEANREVLREKRRAYVRDVRRWREIERKYGLTRAAYEALAVQQGGSCAICRRSLGDVQVHVDHCHSENVVRGLLCQRCNQAIGLLGDSAATARRAANYLEGC